MEILIKKIICIIFDHRWDGSLFRAFMDRTKATCHRCGHVEDFTDRPGQTRMIDY